jgi:polyhydroxyalkanoate synthesis regulator phasin
MSACLLGFIGITLLATGSLFGITAGSLLCTVPALAFTLPEGVEFTETEKKGYLALGNHLTECFKQYETGKITKDEALKVMDDKLKEWAEKNGISAEKIEKMSEALKKQGMALQEMKDRSVSAMPGGLKGLFLKNFDAIKKAVKERRQETFKANPDTIDAALLENRAAITTTTGATLTENNGEDSFLYMKRRDRQYIEDIADISVVAEVPETLTFEEEGDETGAIAIIGENGLKPQLRLKLVKNKVESQKAAGFIVVTEEMMKWRSRAWSAIQRLFRDKVMRDFRNLLTTSLIGNASAYVATPLDGTITVPTNFDAIIAAILQLEMLNFEPDTLVINPADKWKLAMTTTNNGMFILPYIQQGGQFKLLGLQVITTNKVAAGNFLIGEAGIWKVERENPTFRTGLVNDDLIHNRMTIVGEIFFLSYVPSNNAGGFIMGVFDDIKSALEV